MPLREHLRELRRRLIISCIAIIAGTAVGWFLYRPVMTHLIINPIEHMHAPGGAPILPTNRGVASAFNIQVKVSIYLGVIAASPVWLYQLWAFITPGLTRKERRYSLGFVAAAVPLFLCGVALAVEVFPKAIAFGADFALPGSANQPDMETIVTFASRLVIALGTAFLLPLFLVALNMAGLLTGKSLGGHWRVAVFIAFLFAAVVSPSPDATQMIVLALPLVLLYVISVGICLFNDRRRARKSVQEGFHGVSDDEAAPISEAAPLDPVSTIDTSGQIEPDDFDPKE